MEESSAFYPIACESCRNKKSKCSREIPICSQCATAGVICRYPQTNKRGIPSGYVSLIEQRLVETEILVLELTTALREAGGSVDQRHLLSDNERQLLADAAQRQSKTDKIEEWKCFPLGNDRQRQAWWTAKRDYISKPETPSSQEQLGMDSSLTPASQEQLGMDSSLTPAFSPNGLERMQDVENPPPVQSPVRRFSLAITSPAVTIVEAEHHSPRSAHVGVAMDLRSREVDKPVATLPLPLNTPSRSQTDNANKWRKYF